MKYEPKTFLQYWKMMFGRAIKNVWVKFGVLGGLLVLVLYISVNIANWLSDTSRNILERTNIDVLVLLIAIVVIFALGFSFKESSDEYNRQQSLLEKLDGDPVKADIRVFPHPKQEPLNLQSAGIEILNKESTRNITNLRVELQNIGLFCDGEFIGYKFSSDQHIVLNKSDGVIKPDTIISGQQEHIVIADIVDHHVSFLFNRGAEPYIVPTKNGVDVEATDFELKIEVLGTVENSEQIAHEPFNMRMTMTRATPDNSWINIHFSSEEDARIAGSIRA